MNFVPSAFQAVQPAAAVVPWLLSAAPTTASDSRSDSMSTVNGANNKRSLDYCLDAACTTQSDHQPWGTSSPLIRPSERSSLAVEIEDDCDMSQHVFKRMRYSGNGDAIDNNDPLLGDPNAVVPCISEHTVHGNFCRGPHYASQPEPLWWKQRKPPPRCPSTNDGSTCFVCRRPNQIDTLDPASRASTTSTTHTKTLLSFFTPIDVPKKTNAHDNCTRVRPSFSSMDSTTHERHTGSAALVSPPTNGNSCTHCERSDICSNCIRPCEDCQLDFCAFCTTIDAVGSCLCLDCAASQSMRSFNDDDEADMQLD
jgi:hypothetical protein